MSKNSKKRHIFFLENGYYPKTKEEKSICRGYQLEPRQHAVTQPDNRFKQNRHHNIAKSRGGQWLRKNIIWLKVDFHTHALHDEFNNSSLEEIIGILSHLNEWLNRWFPGYSLEETIDIIKRLLRMKANQSDGDLKAVKYNVRFNSHKQKAKG